jgi:hypothetical protein
MCWQLWLLAACAQQAALGVLGPAANGCLQSNGCLQGCFKWLLLFWSLPEVGTCCLQLLKLNLLLLLLLLGLTAEAHLCRH